MRTLALSLLICAAAALAPLLPRARNGAHAAASRGGGGGGSFSWPAAFEGHLLTPLPLGEREQRFAADFPGHIARFTDGTREIILRHTTTATRRLHPASDCLTGAGFRITPLPARLGPGGTAWHCFAASKDAADLSVCEQVRDTTGRTWPDPTTWYWAALLGRSEGPWVATTIVESRER